ncbi:MAG: hypothetical protein HOP17_12895 [Acidobacteria bacterium]|nr:hypothetical protein [Acidobacteriota bacterium]
MFLKIFSKLALAFSSMALTIVVGAQTPTKTEVVANPDGTYSVIEYPVGKEVSVKLLPSAALAGAVGSAKVLRADDGSKIFLNFTGIKGDVTTYHAYAIDPAGMPTYLGPVNIKDGQATAEFFAPLDKFMVVLSPTEGLTSMDASTAVVFRSEVPSGYAVVPTAKTAETKAVAATAQVETTYEVPLLNIPSFNNKTTEVRVNFSGELSGLKGKAYIDPGQKGTTQVKMRFDDMKLAPKDKRLVLWASSPDGKYTKLGQVINNGKRQESEIRSETALADFGLFVTLEDTDVAQPTSKTYSVFGAGRTE